MKLAEDLGAIFVKINVRDKESIYDLFFKIAQKYTGCSEVTVIEERKLLSIKKIDTIIITKLSKWRNY